MAKSKKQKNDNRTTNKKYKQKKQTNESQDKSNSTASNSDHGYQLDLGNSGDINTTNSGIRPKSALQQAFYHVWQDLDSVNSMKSYIPPIHALPMNDFRKIHNCLISIMRDFGHSSSLGLSTLAMPFIGKMQCPCI